MEWLSKIWYPGLFRDTHYNPYRNVILGNRIAILVVGAACFTEAAALLTDRDSAVRQLPLVSPVLVLSLVPFLNSQNHPAAARALLTFFFPIYLIGAGIYENRLYPSDLSVYYNARIGLLLCALIPFMLYNNKSRIPMTLSICLSAAGLLFYNPLLDWVGTGFSEAKIELSAYPSSDLVFVLVFGMIAVMAWSSKRLREHAEKTLTEQNTELAENNHEILMQHEEIMAQADLLRQSEERFQRSHRIIEEQNLKLNRLNADLSSSVKEKSGQLTITNEELVKHNNELLQFSFTISHNLRGPVARLIGLTNLMDMNGGTPEIYEHIRTSSYELEYVLRDLSKIIDIRNEMYRIREKVFFDSEWLRLKEDLSAQLDPHDQIETDFIDAPWIISIRPMISSILYNLVSNAIKYRSYDKALRITIDTQRSGDEVLLRVSDNGLGINLKDHGNDIFKLYKRFHLHKEGKGIGLYLVKTQAEILGARIGVLSEPNKGSEFTVTFKARNEREAQLVMAEPVASMYYHAWLSALEFRWSGSPTLKQLEDIFVKGRIVMKNYATPYLISDVRYRSDVSNEERTFVLENVIPQMFRSGIEKIFLVQSADKISKLNKGILENIQKETRFVIVTSLEEAARMIEHNLESHSAL